jgi:hypothetical protein
LVLGLALVWVVLEPPRATAADDGLLHRKTLPTDRSFTALFGPNQRYPYFENADAFPFQTDARRFALANAWWLAEASMLVYVADKSFVADQFRRVGLNHVRVFRSPANSTHDSQGLIASNDRFAIVVMRGTEPDQPKDFLTDLNLLHTEADDGGQVHLGFKAALDEVWGEMKPHLDALASEGRTIWFTGHSLGAALAVLAADRFGNAAGVYTFGSPRVGDAGFRSRYRQPTYRIVNNTDVVTELPPPVFYRHVGQLSYFGSDHRLNDGIQPDQLLRDRVKGHMTALMTRLSDWAELRFDPIPPKSLCDHAPIDYVTHCWNQLIEAGQ